MRITPLILLKNREAFWAEVRDNQLDWRDLLPLVGFIILACGCYGAVLAGWRSPLLSYYVAVKLPFLFLATTAVVSLFNWMIALLFGANLPFKSTLFIVFASMTVSAWILLSLAPVALFFVGSGVPYAGTHDELRYAHNCILMTHILILAVAGVIGNATLFDGLHKLVPPRCPAQTLSIAWIFSFAFVGCQMSWILRPFVGSPFYPVVFMRPDCFQRNFYEFLFTEIMPYLVTGGR